MPYSNFQNTLPETSTSRNFVQEHQFHPKISSAAAISDFHGQDQTGSTVAADTFN